MTNTQDLPSMAKAGIDLLEQLLLDTPSAQFSEAQVRRFFARFRSPLQSQLQLLLSRALEPVSTRLDREWRGRWHVLDREALWTELDKARRTEAADWLLTRLPVHRPDLKAQGEAWARANQTVLPPSLSVAQPMPAEQGGALLVYDITEEEAPQLKLLPRDGGLSRFAELAYVDDDQSAGVLRDIAASYFGWVTIGKQPVPDEAPDAIRLEQLKLALAQQAPGLAAAALQERASDALHARRQLLAAAGASTPVLLPAISRQAVVVVDRAHAPSPQELLQVLEQAPDLKTREERTAANIRAVKVLEQPSEDQRENWRALVGYSGWGGLSIDSSRPFLPEAYVPQDSALIHEYYTPSAVALAVAEVVRPWVPALPRQADGFVMALEPSAGIGRLVNAASTPGFEQLAWTVVEFSEVSAALLQAIRPDIQIVTGSFESFIQHNESMLAGKLGLVLANPPYGGRGASYTADRNKKYRESKAYVYFIRRCLDLLAAGGVGVFIVPYGLMTGGSGPLMSLRETLLKRHHLRAAFRLPSNLFPGASIVTDALFFEARGGELPAVLPEDVYIVEGKYFQRHPAHILGEEVGAAGSDDDATAKPRWGYEVRGSFAGFPVFEPRLRCLTCTISTAAPVLPRAAVAARLATAELPLEVQSASLLGKRTQRYLTLLASGEHTDIGQAAAMQPELLEALLAWTSNLGVLRNPWQDAVIGLAAKSQPTIVAFLSAFTEQGQVIPQLAQKPAWQPRYEGSKDDLLAQAEWLYSTQRGLTLTSLEEFRKSLGLFSLEPLVAQLVQGGWCFDDGKWLPHRDYYSGLLWDRYYRAKQDADAGDPVAAAQLAQLAKLIQPMRIEEIDPEPRLPWTPLDILSKWLTHWTGKAPPKLVWRDSVLQAAEYSYQQIAKWAPNSLEIAIGYINHDLEYFKPQYRKGFDPNTGTEESAEEALDRARLQYNIKAKASFKEFVLSSTDLATQTEAAYNRLFRGYVLPAYSSAHIAVARWTGRIRPKPHQLSGARRLIENNGGLIAHDVGVGKTFTCILTMAALRQEGRARRPIIVVPNTIIWKWHKEIHAALPDYRVLIVGSNRYIGRSGTFVSKTDTPTERSLKWRQFQSGEYDVALVSYSVFARTQIRASTLREWVYETPVLLRKLSIDARELAKKLDGGEDAIKKPRVTDSMLEKVVGAERLKTLRLSERQELSEKIASDRMQDRLTELGKLQAVVATLSDLSERERAVFGQAIDRWVAERSESHLEPDPDIFFEDLGCDALFIDEAQNFKNLWPVAAREGGVPKYLGAISEGSDRAYALAVRAHLVRKKTGGSGVYLLSATPAKNSPLEYFTLLGYVDSGAWSRLGITDPEVFIDRYLRLEMRDIIAPDMSMSKRSIVAGFKNLDELRSVIFRFAEFRTAEDVGLVLPKPEVSQVTVQMDERQERKYQAYSLKYRDILRRSKDDPKLRMQALGLLQRMALTAIHAELDEGPGGSDRDEEDRESRTGWTWKNASRVTDPSCPKLSFVVAEVLKQPDCGHLVFCDNIAVHRWLVMLLVAAGYPQERIAVFNADQAKDPVKRQSIAERFNGTPAIVGDDGVIEQEAVAPEFDIVIANATAYEGIDLHIRTCKVYHIDLPWEPATLQQRNGRAVRQGNTQAVIGIVYLLSDRSLDVVRLAMITGKLGWMKDVLSSADRETNNPAAQSELSGEEMVLFLARDPEEAKAAIAAQKQLLENERVLRVQQQAWTTLRGLITRIAVLARLSEPAEKQAVEEEIVGLTERLSQIPTTLWPWHFLIPLVQAGQSLIFGSEDSHHWALVEDSYVGRMPEADAPNRAFAVGKIDSGKLGIRRFGQPVYKKLSRDELRSDVMLISPSDVELGNTSWVWAEDEQQFRESLQALIADIATGSWDALELSLAPNSWRSYLVKSWWPQIFASLQAAAAAGLLAFKVPVRVGDKALALLSAEALGALTSATDVVPFAMEEWGPFLRRAIESEERYLDLNTTALAYWGRTFPRGILKRNTELANISVITDSGPIEVRPILVDGSLALTLQTDQGLDHPDGPRYAVTHVPSGRAVARGFRSEQSAAAGLHFALHQKIDWTQRSPAFSSLVPGFTATLLWLRDLDEVPNEETIRRYSVRM